MRRAARLLLEAPAALGAACIGMVVAAYGYEVVMRYFLGAPTAWVNSVTVYLTLAASMLLLPRVTHAGQHVAIDLLAQRASPQWRQSLALATALISALTCLAAAWFALSETRRQLLQGVRTTDTLALPRWWITAFVVWGLAGAGLVFVARCAGELRATFASRDGNG